MCTDLTAYMKVSVNSYYSALSWAGAWTWGDPWRWRDVQYLYCFSASLSSTWFDFIWMLCGPALCTSVFLNKATYHHKWVFYWIVRERSDGIMCKMTHECDSCLCWTWRECRFNNCVFPKARELVSSEYCIWNSTGDAPVSSGPVIL